LPNRHANRRGQAVGSHRLASHDRAGAVEVSNARLGKRCQQRRIAERTSEAKDRGDREDLSRADTQQRVSRSPGTRRLFRAILRSQDWILIRPDGEVVRSSRGSAASLDPRTCIEAKPGSSPLARPRWCRGQLWCQQREGRAQEVYRLFVERSRLWRGRRAAPR